MELIGKGVDYKPTPEEIQEAYGYLDYCLNCGKKFIPGEAFSHGILGNCHLFGCGYLARFLGYIYTILKIIFLLIIAIPVLIVMGIVKLNKNLRELKRKNGK